MSDLSVAVIGLGASGILAAKAAEDFGCETVHVFSVNEHWTPPGSFWLHWLPEYLAKQFTFYPIYQAGVGTEYGYRKLQWGTKIAGLTSSFPEEDNYTYGYNPQEVFPTIMPKNVMKLMLPLSDSDMREVANMYDVVFQTFPSEKSKEQQPELVYFYVGEVVHKDPNEVLVPNRVIYYGTEDSVILRESFLWGRHFYEFPKNLPLEEIQKAPSVRPFKPVKLWDMNPYTKPWKQRTDVPRNIHLVGRWAEWNTKRLSHEAYIIAQKVLEEKAND